MGRGLRLAALPLVCTNQTNAVVVNIRFLVHLFRDSAAVVVVLTDDRADERAHKRPTVTGFPTVGFPDLSVHARGFDSLYICVLGNRIERWREH